MPTLFKGESERDAGELLGKAMQTKDFERENDNQSVNF